MSEFIGVVFLIDPNTINQIILCIIKKNERV